MGAYGVGRRFELHIVEKLRKLGIRAERVPLSGRVHKLLPAADLIVEGRWVGKAKTTKAKKYLSFPHQEVAELLRGKLDFLVFGFRRTEPLFVIRLRDFAELVQTRKKGVVSECAGSS
jgi:Holliday junction resolvase